MADLTACGAQGVEPIYRTKGAELLGRRPTRPRCNRTAGHPGPHRMIDRRTFVVLAEWGDADTVTPR